MNRVFSSSARCAGFLFLVLAVYLLSLPAFVRGQTLPAQAPTEAQAQPGSPSGDCSELPVLKQRLESAQTRMMDWAQMARYRETNAKLAPPAKNERRVVFLGDSITDSWSGPAFGGFFPGKPYINRGISGQTTRQMLVRFRQDVIALRPKVVVILAGTNDIAGNTGLETLSEIEEHLETIAELARLHRIGVVLASVLPVNDHGHNRAGEPTVQTKRRPPEQILELNVWLKRYASEQHHTYLDYFSKMADAEGRLKRELSDDGLHPNAQGYTVMAPLAEQAIQAALKRKP